MLHLIDTVYSISASLEWRGILPSSHFYFIFSISLLWFFPQLWKIIFLFFWSILPLLCTQEEKTLCWAHIDINITQEYNNDIATSFCDYFHFIFLFLFVHFLLQLDLPTSGPVIQGEEKQYQIGDILSLNCTSGKSSPRSILTFYINDEPVSMKMFELWTLINGYATH